MADIGDRIRAERQARGWSQERLGEQAGMTKHQIRRMESGVIGMRNLLIACWALGVDVGYLLSDGWRLPASEPSLTPRQAEVLSAAADGAPLAVVAQRLEMPREGLASHLSDIYVRLGVADRGLGERRAAAVRVAQQLSLI